MLSLRKYSLLLLLITLLLNCGYSCSNAAPTFSVNDRKFEIVRQFFASALEPQPGQDISQSPLKTACITYPEALWLIANEPETLEKDPILKIILKNMELDIGKLKGVGIENIKTALNAKPDAFYQELSDSLDKSITSFKFDKLEALQKLSKIQIPALGKDWTSFLQNILVGYFPSLELIDKKRVFAALLLNTMPESDNTEILLSLVYAAGPFFQKYMQLLGDKLQTEGDPELNRLKDGLMEVKSGLPGINSFYVKQYLQEIKDAGNADLEIKKSLGAASVGETFLAELGSGEKKKSIVIKLMRPGVEEIAKREAIFFQAQADDVSKTMGKSFAVLKEQIFAEMDYTIELKRLIQGFNAYNESDTVVRAVGPIEGFKNGKHWLGMNFAPGKTFKDIRALEANSDNPDLLYQAKANLLIKGLLLQILTDRYLKKAFFVSPNGFFHGDLHEGNVLMYVSPEVYSLLREQYKLIETANQSNAEQYLAAIQKIMQFREEGEPLIQLTLIDFSNAHSLNHKEREGMLNLFASTIALSNSATAFLDALNLLDPSLVTSYNQSQLKQELKMDAFRLDNSYGTLKRFSRAIDVLMNNELPLPGSIIAFSRSLAMIDNSYDQLSSDLGFEQFNLTRTIEQTIICPVATQLPYLPAFITKLIIIYTEYGDQGSCNQTSDITLSRANQKAIYFGWKRGMHWWNLIR